MEYSLICPIHNEEKYVYSWLKNTEKLRPTEIIMGLDRCTDNTEKRINDYISTHKIKSEIILEYYEKKINYTMRVAGIRRDLYQKAFYDVVLNTSADLLCDVKIRNYIKDIGKYGLISFGYFDYPFTYQCFIRRVISSLSPISGFAGLLAFSRKAWLDTEDLDSLSKITRAEDTHLHLAIRRKYRVKHINTESFHLRHNEHKRDHYLRGVAQYRLLKNSWVKTFLHSFIMLRPSVLTGYLHSKKGLIR